LANSGPGWLFRPLQGVVGRWNILGTKQMTTPAPLVSIIMGSKSDWEIMRECARMLVDLEIPNEYRVISAHRTPALAAKYASEAAGRGVQVIIAGAGGAAHLAGVIAAQTLVPVLGVPILSKLSGLDSLLSTVQMPAGIPVGTLAIGTAGAKNAALFAAAILALNDPELRKRLETFREKQTSDVINATLELE